MKRSQLQLQLHKIVQLR